MITNVPTFPSPLASDRGSKKWIEKYIKACWADWSSINSNSFYNGRDRYSNIKKYMNGNQEMDKYFKMLDVDSANPDESWLKAVKEPLPIGAKYARMTKTTLMKNSYNINLTAIDPISGEEKNEYYAQNRAKIELRDMLEENGLPKDLVETPDKDFETVKELDIHMKHEYKSEDEVQAEILLSVIMNNCGHDSIRLLNIDQLHDYGFVGYKDYVDMNGDIKERFVDVNNFIVSRCKFPDFRDSFYRGEVLDYTIGDLKQLDKKKEIREEQYIKLVESKGTRYSYETFGNNNKNPQDYENQRVQVLEIEFDGIDSYTVEFGEDEIGNKTKTKRVRGIDYVEKGKDFTTAEYPVKYVGYWVIGTDIFFGCGLQTDMKRAKNNLADVQSCYHVIAPNLYNMETRGMSENYIPIIDTLQIAFMKYQDVIVNAKRKGILIDIHAMENLPIGKGGQALSPIEGYKFWAKTGSMIYRSVKEDGTMSGTKPITELNNGIGDEALRYYTEIQNCIGLFQQTGGFNDLTDGSTPGERTLKAVAERANESTNNSIEYMARAERMCFESLASGLLLRINDAAENDTLDNYINAIGKDSIRFFGFGKDFTSRELGIEVKDEPTDAQYQRLQEKVKLAIQSDQITLADSFVVENIKNLKQAESVLAFKIEQNIKQKQKIALENQQMQLQATKAASEGKLQEIQMEHQLSMEKKQFEIQSEKELTDQKYAYELELKRMEVTGRVEGHKVQADAKIYSSDKSAQSTAQKTAVEAENNVITTAMSKEKEEPTKD